MALLALCMMQFVADEIIQVDTRLRWKKARLVVAV